MPLSTELQLLLVTNDYATLRIVRSAAAQLGAGLACMATAESACDYIGRRKIDGIFVDLEIPAWEQIVDALRQGTFNHFAVVFACMTNRVVAKEALKRGAHVILHKPLSVGDVVSRVQSARELMIRERRRFFRHQVYLPVSLTVNGAPQHALMTNLSEGGMAVRVTQSLECSLLLDFAFQLRAGPVINGRGHVAWRDNQGMIGIGFQFIRDRGKDELLTWIRQQERLTPQHPSWGPASLTR
ncbi:MAG TPA: PilZ domain-containing protein [Dongiaceae bacterium]|nr:PilZ domain-containing protein [Dongiaceae bacterium]